MRGRRDLFWLDPEFWQVGVLDHHGCPRASRLTSGKTSLGRHGTQSRGCAGQTVRSCSNACHGAPLWGATKMHGGGRSPPANRSLRLSNQSAASSKRKLEKFEQRPALKIPRSKVPSSYNGRPETLRGKLTLGNVGGSHTQGNQLAETALVGCPSWIHIELCAALRNPLFGGFWRISGSSG